MATGTIYRLHAAGFPVLVLETECPTTVRRMASVSQAVFDGGCTVEDMQCRRIASAAEIDPAVINVMVDPKGVSISEIKPHILIDATIAKHNTGMSPELAPLTIALGPGFTAPRDVRCVIETMRGHTLGRVITDGAAAPDTKCPGVIMGYSAERVLRAPASGHLVTGRKIGDMVNAGDAIGEINGHPVTAQISGVIRGLIHAAVECFPGMKIGDIDPRGIQAYCFTISDKSLSVAGGVMEAVSRFFLS